MKRLGIIFAGGGTGGHLFPALAIADRLKEMIGPEGTPDFRFIGTKKGLEFRMRDKLGYPLSLITIKGLSRSGFLRNLLFPFLLIGAMLKSMILILRFRPDIIVGTGGYVMGPVLMAATALYKRSVIQEQNSYPGLTTRKLATKVDKLFLGYDVARKHLDKLCTTMVTGNPVKSTIGMVSRVEARKKYGFTESDQVILILGGSQGAASINQNIADNFGNWPDNVKLIWQTGKLNYDEIKNGLGDKLKDHEVFAFTDEIEKTYAAADIAISRAGALTLAELEAAGLPAILIPYPYAAEDHQRKNAEYYAEKKAALIIDNKELSEYNVPAFAADLIESGQVNLMKNAMKQLATEKEKPAVDIIAEEILNIVDWKGRND